MENVNYSDELQHHGIMGMKWGQRRYQNKDGTLTPAGQKRYNKEVEKLKKETARVKAEEQIAINRKKTQAKLDQLESRKRALEERKKALKEEKNGKNKKGEPDKNTDETPEQRKERLLKSSDPKELYKYRDELSYIELNDRVNRIDLENKLQSRIIEDHKTTGLEYMDKVRNVIDKSSALYKSVDTAYSNFANSSIAKAMGLDLPTGKEEPKRIFNAEEFIKRARANKLTYKEIQDGTNALKNINTAEQQKKQIDKQRTDDKDSKKRAKEAEQKAKEADRKAKEAEDKAAQKVREAEDKAREAEEREQAARKIVDEYNERWMRDNADDKITVTGYSPNNAYRMSKNDVNNGREIVNQVLLEGPISKDPIDVTPKERT